MILLIKNSQVNLSSFRPATDKDVERIKAANPSSKIEVGQEIRFNIDKQSKIEPENVSDPTQFEIKVGQAAKAAPGIFKEMTSPKTAAAYFKDRKIGGEKIIAARINTSMSEAAGRGSKTPKILELDFVSGSSTAKGERTEFTDTMKFDLNNTTRLKTLINLLDDSDILKQELRKLIKNPLLK